MTKKVFENFSQDHYETLLREAKDKGIHHLHDFFPDYPYGGFTVAWQRTTDKANCKMIKVAISTCSPNDQFCRKVGTYLALNNMDIGEYVKLPIGDEDSSVIVRRIRDFLKKL